MIKHENEEDQFHEGGKKSISLIVRILKAFSAVLSGGSGH